MQLWTVHRSLASCTLDFAVPFVVGLLVRCQWLSDHDVHGTACTLFEVNLLLDVESHLPVNDEIAIIRALQGTSSSLCVRHLRDMLNELPAIPLASTASFGPNIDQIPRVVISGPEDSCFRVMKKG